MKLKKGVNQRDIKPAIWFALGIAEMVFKKFGCVNVVTSLADPDPKRVSGSLHAVGLAGDCRARMNKLTQQLILGVLVAELNPLGFDIILHGDGASLHFHIEYDPKNGESWQESVA